MEGMFHVKRKDKGRSTSNVITTPSLTPQGGTISEATAPVWVCCPPGDAQPEAAVIRHQKSAFAIPLPIQGLRLVNAPRGVE